MSGDADSKPALHTLDFAILGTARSGTSALSRLINEDPGCFCGTEYFSGAWKADYATMAMPEAFLGPEFRATNEQNTKLTQTTLRRKLEAGKVVAYGNKHPSYFLIMEQLQRQLPALRSLFIYRDIGEVSVSWDRRAANPKDRWQEGRTGLFSLLEWIISVSRLGEAQRRIRIVDYAALFFTDPQLAKRVIFFVSGRMPSVATLERIHGTIVRGGAAPAPAVTRHDAFLATIGNDGLRALIHGQGFVPARVLAAQLGDFAAANLPKVFDYVAARIAEEGSAAERGFALQWAQKKAQLFDNPGSRTYAAMAASIEGLLERLCAVGGGPERERADTVLAMLRRRGAQAAAARAKLAAKRSAPAAAD